MAQLPVQSHRSGCFHTLHMVLGMITLPQNDLCFCICSLWKTHPDSCDVFIMCAGFQSLCYISTSLSPWAEKRVPLGVTGKSSSRPVFWSLQGRARVEECHCLRNFPNVPHSQWSESLVLGRRREHCPRPAPKACVWAVRCGEERVRFSRGKQFFPNWLLEKCTGFWSSINLSPSYSIK